MHEKSKNNATQDELQEVMDDTNRPIALLSRDEVHRQLLPHRSVQILVYDQQNKLFLQKRSARKRFYPGRWDVSARGHTLPQESNLDAAQRILSSELRLEVDRLNLIRQFPSCPETGYEFVSIFTTPKITQLPAPNGDEVEDGYFFTSEELTCLIKDFRELLTPGLVTLWESGLAFPF
ncbi:NUDIX hydrolase [Desulfovibrio oxyclinae]|uniref:NUDIX hydrolase n=1 Tax=Desulfovibrio oxyclinae TaxID=63560 RepID=UPI0003717FEB|nr:NUDIX domain-containing protein [Desulfovibrio oxyclinae]